jgi:hypothetical protein
VDVDGWTCHPNMVLTRQSEGSVTKSGVKEEVFGNASWIRWYHVVIIKA